MKTRTFTRTDIDAIAGQFTQSKYNASYKDEYYCTERELAVQFIGEFIEHLFPEYSYEKQRIQDLEAELAYLKQLVGAAK